MPRKGRYKDLRGEVFHMLTVVAELPPQIKADGNNCVWLCQCQCGKQIARTTASLKASVRASCGCKRGTHRLTKTRTYTRWQGMIQRCEQPCSPSYAHYRKRNITISTRWRHSFETFLSDMGECPPGMTLERIDNAGNYELGNCRWATWKEQGQNRSTNRRYEYEGKSYLLEELATLCGHPMQRLRARMRNGWSVEEAVRTPHIPRYLNRTHGLREKHQ